MLFLQQKVICLVKRCLIGAHCEKRHQGEVSTMEAVCWTSVEINFGDGREVLRFRSRRFYLVNVWKTVKPHGQLWMDYGVLSVRASPAMHVYLIIAWKLFSKKERFSFWYHWLTVLHTHANANNNPGTCWILINVYTVQYSCIFLENLNVSLSCLSHTNWTVVLQGLKKQQSFTNSSARLLQRCSKTLPPLPENVHRLKILDIQALFYAKKHILDEFRCHKQADLKTSFETISGLFCKFQRQLKPK